MSGTPSPGRDWASANPTTMNAAAIQSWLRRKNTSDAAVRRVTAVLALAGGLVVLFLTFWFTYAIVWFAFHGVAALGALFANQKLRLGHEWRLVISGVFVVLLFIQHLRTSPWHWGEYPERDDYSRLAGRVLGPWALLKYSGASANMIADILLSGPRLVTGSWQLWREAARLRSLDAEVCSRLLAFLLSRPEVVPYDELCEAGWEEWFGQLRGLEGLVFLERGLKLSAELRQELLKL
jgi:hypothetical protein